MKQQKWFSLHIEVTTKSKSFTAWFNKVDMFFFSYQAFCLSALSLPLLMLQMHFIFHLVAGEKLNNKALVLRTFCANAKKIWYIILLVTNDLGASVLSQLLQQASATIRQHSVLKVTRDSFWISILHDLCILVTCVSNYTSLTLCMFPPFLQNYTAIMKINGGLI